jgi:hypothetical protein
MLLALYVQSVAVCFDMLFAGAEANAPLSICEKPCFNGELPESAHFALESCGDARACGFAVALNLDVSNEQKTLLEALAILVQRGPGCLTGLVLLKLFHLLGNYYCFRRA